VFRAIKTAAYLLALIVAVEAAAQGNYEAGPIAHAGTIAGTVKWSGPLPRIGYESLATTQKYLEPSKETEKQLEEMKLPF
jgi:hypothetical protein